MDQKLVDDDYNAYPEKYEAAARTYLSLSVEQREIADEFYERGYSGHPLHLIADNTRNTSEKDVVKSNRENHGDSLDDISEAPGPSKCSIAPRSCFVSAGKFWK